MNTAIIYHHPCIDGFSSYYIANRALEKNGVDAIGIQGSYNNIKKILNKIALEKIEKIYFVDFSLKSDIILDLLNKGIDITIIDHHIGVLEQLNKIDHPNFEFIFNNGKSGALLTWEYFNKNQPVPKVIEHISDRDLWRFELENTKEINSAIFSYPYSLKTWDIIMDDSYLDSLILEGTAISRKHDKDIHEMIYESNFVEYLPVKGGYAFMVNVPYFYSSEILNTLLNTCRDDYNHELFAFSWTKNSLGYQISFRSDEKGVDVSKIAQKFGGNGHRNSSGALVKDFEQFKEKLSNIDCIR